jgi:tripartite-type tricarboxylate transporter receptor subunit TctC
MNRRSLLSAAAALLAAPRLAAAQGNWPDRPVRVIVPFTPGGSTDILARAIAAELQEVFGQPFVIENRGGAGGTVGSEMVARSAPDGYTIMMGHIGTLAVNPSLYRGLSFDPATAFAPIGMMAIVPNVLVVNPRKVAANNIQELIALLKGRPNAFTYGSGGNGSAAHTAMVAFCQATGTEMEHIPYRGTGPMMNDLVAGTIDMTLTGGPAALPAARNNLVKALGVSSLRRLSSAPDIPTIAEQGVPGFDATQWYGLVAPAGTPRPIIDRINEAQNRILNGPRLRPRLEAEGADAAPGTPEEYRDFIARERTRWGELIRTTNMRAD